MTLASLKLAGAGIAVLAVLGVGAWVMSLRNSNALLRAEKAALTAESARLADNVLAEQRVNVATLEAMTEMKIRHQREIEALAAVTAKSAAQDEEIATLNRRLRRVAAQAPEPAVAPSVVDALDWVRQRRAAASGGLDRNQDRAADGASGAAAVPEAGAP